MYLKHYQLRTMPFESTPDPRFFFESEQHREALAAIEYTIRMRKGFVLITGDIGSGKTTVGRTMVRRCADRANILQVLHGHRTPNELLKQVMRAMNLKYKIRDDHGRILERLQTHLLQEARAGKPIVLFVDEAQTLSDDALEELRLLSNFDTSTSKLIQVILVGQPELRQRICQPKLSALRQRIVMAKQLSALTAQQTGSYIAHRIRVASENPGEPKASFSLPAVAEIHHHCGGVPRLINTVCDNCMLMGYVKQTEIITPAMVRRVVADIIPRFDDSLESDMDQDRPRLRFAGGM